MNVIRLLSGEDLVDLGGDIKIHFFVDWEPAE